MRIVFIDIDTLRPDHMGCYGYHRNTSPAMDEIAKDSVRFEGCFVSDAPCLPSRSALHHGRFGIHNRAVNHGGKFADPYIPPEKRSFMTDDDYKKWAEIIQKQGYKTASISSFAGRHSAHWFTAGFNEIYDCGKGGNELAPEVVQHALDFIKRNANKENWFLHFNIWDPHTPYRVPDEYGNPFEKEPIADWVKEDMIKEQNNLFGTHSATEALGDPNVLGREWYPKTNREVMRIESLNDYKTWIDGYDVGIKYSDDAVGKITALLKELGIYEDTAIIITSDHGENQGELNVYGDHQTADLITHRVPMIVKWPGVDARVDYSLRYQFDIASTVLELIGARIPAKWDGKSFKDAFEKGKDENGRDYLVLSQATWSCQRGVIFDDYILIRTYMDGLKELPEIMLFNRKEDPHELKNLAEEKPEIVNKGLALIEKWTTEEIKKGDIKTDVMMEVVAEGGPYHTRAQLENYINYYRNLIKREDLAQKMEKRYEGVYGYSKNDY